MRFASALVGVCMLLGVPSSATGAAASALADGGQRPDPNTPVAIVESFLLDRAMGDFAGAAGRCAPLLELQDSKASWFLDAPGTREWLRQLSTRYVIDPLSHPSADANSVAWTERLSQRGIPFPEALRSSTSVPVQAVIRDGKIVHLSGPYPPLLFPSDSASREPGVREAPPSRPGTDPFTFFIGSALGLALAVPLASVLYRAALRGWKRRSSPVRPGQPRANSWCKGGVDDAAATYSPSATTAIRRSS